MCHPVASSRAARDEVFGVAWDGSSQLGPAAERYFGVAWDGSSQLGPAAERSQAARSAESGGLEEERRTSASGGRDRQ